MTKNLVRFYISAAAVLAAFCVIAFVVPFAKTAVFWLSLVFGVIAIVVQLYTMPRARPVIRAQSFTASRRCG